MSLFSRSRLETKAAKKELEKLYGAQNAPRQLVRYQALSNRFIERFGAGEFSFFSAPGRTEIVGNHTDHNHGLVLAGSVQKDILCAARRTDDSVVTLVSDGYADEFRVDLSRLEADPRERGTTAALIRGIARRFSDLGCPVGGLNAYVVSNVPRGSGLSSSAAVEILLCTVFSHFYRGAAPDPVEAAKISQWAENEYFGKPCGLMDQLACAGGGMVLLDLKDPAQPAVTPLWFDFQKSGYVPVLTDVHADHADLTEEYASITREMHEVAAYFGKETLREVEPKTFFCSVGELYGTVSDRAILRAMHFYGENARVVSAGQALQKGDVQAFLQAVNESGSSSWQLLQNLYRTGSSAQAAAVALAVSRHVLAGDGACRIHGGGFGGTVLAFVPVGLKNAYINQMNRIFGDGAAEELEIRQSPAMKLEL